MTVHEALN